MGNLTFILVGWGKFNWKCKVLNDFFFFFGAEVAKSYKQVFGLSEEFWPRLCHTIK